MYFLTFIAESLNMNMRIIFLISFTVCVEGFVIK